MKEFNDFCKKYKINILKQYELNFNWEDLLFFAIQTNKNKLISDISELNNTNQYIKTDIFSNIIKSGIRSILNSSISKPKNLSTLKILLSIDNIATTFYSHSLKNIINRSKDDSEFKFIEFIKPLALGEAGLNDTNYWHVVAEYAMKSNNNILLKRILPLINTREFNVSFSITPVLNKDILDIAGEFSSEIFNLLFDKFIDINSKDFYSIPIKNTFLNKHNLIKCLNLFNDMKSNMNESEKEKFINEFQYSLKYNYSSKINRHDSFEHLIILKEYGFVFPNIAHNVIKSLLNNEKYDDAFRFSQEYDYCSLLNPDLWQDSLLKIIIPKNDVNLFQRFEFLKEKDSAFEKPSNIIKFLSSEKLLETDISHYLIQQIDKPLLEAIIDNFKDNEYLYAYLTGELFRKNMNLDAHQKSKKIKI